MPELIDKQKVQTEIALIAKYFAKSDAQKAIIGRILFMIDHMPTIDPEVRHGRWKKKNEVIYCTNCKKSNWAESFELMLRRFYFCPNCGARMDGGAKDEK